MRDRRRLYLAGLLINRQDGKAPFHHLANDLVPRLTLASSSSPGRFFSRELIFPMDEDQKLSSVSVLFSFFLSIFDSTYFLIFFNYDRLRI